MIRLFCLLSKALFAYESVLLVDDTRLSTNLQAHPLHRHRPDTTPTPTDTDYDAQWEILFPNLDFLDEQTTISGL